MGERALLIDASGHNYVKLAMARSRERPDQSVSYHCLTFSDFSQAIEDFMASKKDLQLIGAAVAACGWERDGDLAMPNDQFHIRRAWLLDLLKIRRLNLVNDCVCKAMAVPLLRPDETRLICGGEGDDTQPRLLIGASFGLGSALVITDDLNEPTVLPTECGHTDLPAITAREQAVLEVMVAKYGRVSRERAVSLQGLREIWRCLEFIDKHPVGDLPAEEIAALARAGDPRAVEAVALCSGWLAATAADAALTTGARGGIYLSGTLIELTVDLWDMAAFTDRFNARGRLSSYISEIPVRIIMASEPEMIGLSTLFQ